MTALPKGLTEHLASGATTLCRCWGLTRRDGREFNFTDHDAPVTLAGKTFLPTDAPTVRAIEQTTGLAVDNSEALGALSDAGLSERDIVAGRFDGAIVKVWMVNWSDPRQFSLQFNGEIGEIERSGGAFKAELRGLTEALNQPQGRIYQQPCRAVLGDRECGVDLNDPQFVAEVVLSEAPSGTILSLPHLSHPAGWFDRGLVEVVGGAAAGDTRLIKADRPKAGGRQIEMWDTLQPEVGVGDRIRMRAGCDKTLGMCTAKFNNVVNYRGFPFLPSEDWLYAYPKSGETS